MSSSKYHVTAHVSGMAFQLLSADIAQDVLERMIAMDDHKFSGFGLGVPVGQEPGKGNMFESGYFGLWPHWISVPKMQ